MKNNDFKIDINQYSANILIIDEVGDLPFFVIENLIKNNYFVYYFSLNFSQNIKIISDQFKIISNLSDLKKNTLIDYQFYFTNDDDISNDDKKISENNINFLIENNVKTLFFTQIDSTEKLTNNQQKYFKNNNVKNVFYKDLFGPSIKKGIISNFFSSLNNGSNHFVFKDKFIFLLFVKDLAKLIAENFVSFFKEDTLIIGEKKETDLFLKTVLSNNQNFSWRIEKEGDIQINEDIRLISVLPQDSLEENIHQTFNWISNNSEKNVIKTNFERNYFVTEQLIPDSVVIKETLVEEKIILNDRDKLEFLFKKKTEEKRLNSNNYKKPKNKKKKVNNLLTGVIIFLVLAGSFFVAPIVFLVKNINSAQNRLYDAVNSSSNYSLLFKNFDEADKNFDNSEKIFNLILPFSNIFGFNKNIEQISHNISFGKQYSSSNKYSLLATFDLAKIFSLLIKGESNNQLKQLSLDINQNFSNSIESVLMAQSINEISKNILFSKNINYRELQAGMLGVKNYSLKNQSILPVLESIVLEKGRKTYLILIQNSFELRPTGGFISSVGILDMENGKINGLNIYDINDLDKNLSGQIEPPPKIKEKLGEVNWYFRDSNWDPNFVYSAKKAMWFLDKEMQSSVDGVISINSLALKKMIKLVDYLDIQGIDEKINFQNFDLKLIESVESNQFKLSENRIDFLGGVLNSLFKKVKEGDTALTASFVKEVFQLLEEKQIIYFVNDQKIQNVLLNLNWHGGVRTFQTKAPVNFEIETDYLYLNEANVGINQINYYIERKIDHEITISKEGSVLEKLLINFENKSISEKWPFGKYKNYLRIYLPKDVTVSGILYNENKENKIWKSFDVRQSDISEVEGKTVIGLYIEVPPKSIKDIQINYERTKKISLQKKILSYLLMVQKQSGIEYLDYRLSVKIPQNLIPVRVIPKAVVENQKLIIIEKLLGDKIFQIDLAK